MRATSSTASRSVDAHLPLIFALGLYYAVHAAIRVQAPGNATLAESEQLLMARWLQWGYSPNPPLYTWLQAGLFRLMGETVASLTLLRSLLMLSTFAGFHLIARCEFGDRTRTLLASVSLLLMFELVWANQVQHTVALLSLTLAVWQFRVLQAVLKSPRLSLYLVSGAIAAAGLLTQYCYGLYLLALMIALCCSEKGRSIVLHRRMLPALALAVALLVPHLSWLREQSFSVWPLNATAHTQGSRVSLSAFGLLALSVVIFLSPLWLICLGLFPGAWKTMLRGRQVVATAFSYPIYLLAALVILSAVAAGVEGDVNLIRDSGLQPLLFLFPIAFFTCVAHESLTPIRRRVFIGAAMLAGLLALAVHTWQVVPPKFKTDMTPLDHPFGEIAAALKQSGLPLHTIVTDDIYVAGSLRLHLPQSALYAANPRLRLPRPAPDNTALLLWEANDRAAAPSELLQRVQSTTGCVLDAEPGSLDALGPRLTVRYGKARAASYALGTARLRC